MSNGAKEIAVIVCTDVVALGLIGFAAVGMVNQGCPYYAVVIWAAVCGFFLGYGMVDLGFKLIGRKDEE